MRRARRSRLSTNFNLVVNALYHVASNDPVVLKHLEEGNKNKAFGRLLNSWMDPVSKESVIDAYVDEDAFKAVNYALYRLMNK